MGNEYRKTNEKVKILSLRNGTNIQIHRTMNFSNGNIENVEVDSNHREVLNNIREVK